VAEHLEFRSGIGGCTVIDDTWNVAPLSMAAALDVLRNVAASKTKIAVLGYMPQLGDGEDARREYAKIGEKAVEAGVDVLIVVGDEAKEIGRKALELGMDPNDVFFCRTGTEVYAILQTFANRDAVVLLKIPHRVMMEDSFREMKTNLIV
jgi:UDP-N-acetylmuramyl pentapeptide synthase